MPKHLVSSRSWARTHSLAIVGLLDGCWCKTSRFGAPRLCAGQTPRERCLPSRTLVSLAARSKGAPPTSPSTVTSTDSKKSARIDKLRRHTVEKKLVHTDPREPPRDGLLGGVPRCAEREVRHDGRRLEEDREGHADVAGPGWNEFDRTSRRWRLISAPVPTRPAC